MTGRNRSFGLAVLILLAIACGGAAPISPPPAETTTTSTTQRATTTTGTATTRTIVAPTTSAQFARAPEEVAFLSTLEDWISRSGGFNFLAQASDLDRLQLANSICTLLSAQGDIMAVKDALLEEWGNASDDLIDNVIILAIENFCSQHSYMLWDIGCIDHPGEPHVIGGLNHDHCADDFQTYGTSE